MANKSNRWLALDKLLGKSGAADEIAEQLEDLEETLDDQGIAHKALSLDALDAWFTKKMVDIQNMRIEQVTKANITTDDMVDFVVLAYEQIVEAGPEADPREVAMDLVRTAFERVEEPAKEVDITVGEEGEEAPPPEEEEDEDGETKARKLDLMETVSDDTAATLKAILDTQAMLAALQDTPGRIEAVENALSAIHAQLSQRPRASESDESRLDLGRIKQIVNAAVKAEVGNVETVTVAGITGLLPEAPKE